MIVVYLAMLVFLIALAVGLNYISLGWNKGRLMRCKCGTPPVVETNSKGWRIYCPNCKVEVSSTLAYEEAVWEWNKSVRARMWAS